MMLDIKNLQAKTGQTDVLRGVDLSVKEGEVLALMGPNGSGKSSLAHVLMGHPSYEVTKGTVQYNGQDLVAMKPEERARAGLFLSFQYPQEVAGVTLGSFLRLAYNQTHESKQSVTDFLVRLKQKMDLLKISHEFITRSVNEGFSGGEKKRVEMLQLAVLEPKLAILDEVDSGLDIDALKIVAEAIQTIQATQPLTLILITHYQRMLQYVKPDRVAVMYHGKVVQEGGAELVTSIEESGYKALAR